MCHIHKGSGHVVLAAKKHSDTTIRTTDYDRVSGRDRSDTFVSDRFSSASLNGISIRKWLWFIQCPEEIIPRYETQAKFAAR